VPIVVTNPGPDQKRAARNRKPAAPDQVPAAADQKPAAPGERRPVAMTPYAIAVALFAAYVVGGILAKAVPLWLAAVIGLAIGAAVFVFVDRYLELAPEPVAPPTQAILAGGGQVLVVPGPQGDFPRHRIRLLRRAGLADP
jgi:hypothetical protein